MFDARHLQLRIEFGELCAAARRDRIDLGARGFYATPGVDYNRETGRGNPFFYFTQGAAACGGEIDRFTGELSCRGSIYSWISAARSTRASTWGKSSAASSKAWAG